MIQNWQEFLQQKSLQTPFITKLSQFGIIKVTGPNAEKFLQGQLSCDIKKINKNTSTLGAYCNIKGRVECFFRIFILDNCYYLRLPLSLVKATLKELQKYILFSKVEVTDASNELIKIGVSGQNIENFLLSSLSKLDNQNNNQTVLIQIFNSNPSLQSSLQSRFELYAKTNSNKTNFLINNLEQNIQYVSNNLWELLEINDKIPEIYPETVGKFLPHYINLPQLKAVSFNKGCFRGQEIIARMEYKGNIKRHLQHISCSRSNLNVKLPLPGEDLLSTNNNNIIGKIIRSSFDHNQHIQALAEIAVQAINEPFVLASNNSCIFNLIKME